MRYIDLGTIDYKTKRRSERVLRKLRFFKLKRKKLSIFLILVAFVGIVFASFHSKFFKSFAVFSQIASGPSLKSTDGRVNILALGLDKRDSGQLQTGILTDTIIVASVGVRDADIKVISIPRDLWVKFGDGRMGKINAAYAEGGANLTKKIVENVLGIPIHYYIVVGFDGFEDVINALGGVTVNVERTFDDYYYPIFGKELDTCGVNLEDLDEKELKEQTFPCRYEHLHFDKGKNFFDGKTALKYVRSRHGTNGEGNDFARAKRQQNLLLAVKDKLLSLGTLSNPMKVKDLYNLYKKYVVTNIGIADVDGFYKLSKNVDFNSIETVVLSNSNVEEKGGLLYTPADTSYYGGAYVLLPKSGDFSQVHAFVQRFLFASE